MISAALLSLTYLKHLTEHRAPYAHHSGQLFHRHVLDVYIIWYVSWMYHLISGCKRLTTVAREAEREGYTEAALRLLPETWRTQAAEPRPQAVASIATPSHLPSISISGTPLAIICAEFNHGISANSPVLHGKGDAVWRGGSVTPFLPVVPFHFHILVEAARVRRPAGQHGFSSIAYPLCGLSKGR